LHVAQRFEHFLDDYRRPDGSRWTGQKLDEATGGVVPRSYFTNLRKGRIDSPGYEKMLAMGFPPALWFENAPGAQAAPTEGQDLAARVGHLFDTIVYPGTGEPYPDADVARMSAGVLTEEDVAGIRTGKIPDPSVGQVAALAAAFGVPTSYLVDRDKGTAVLDAETLDALADETANAILRESTSPPERERRIVLGIVREFGAQHDAGR
jgi:hypothetical protein